MATTKITRDDITAEQFDAYIRLRDSGAINMFDAKLGAQLIGESEEVYRTIMLNFSYLRNKFDEHGQIHR